MAKVDGALLASAVSGDRTATDRLLGLLHPVVLRYCRARLGDRHYRDGDADDCAQEVLLGVLGALPGYRYGAARFPNFVHAVAAHKVVDAYRHRGDDVSVPVPEVPPAPSDLPEPHRHVEELELRRRVRLLLDLLVPAQRDIVVLRVMVGLSAEETADELGVASSGAVRVSQHRALTALRRHLAAADVR
ncbi:DNA-directed RNA polymerase sigma-70 factor [Amycolatopsis sp. NBRC 101858]|uniref:sigma-70 family RNA polymerase sigma factor n=1 Tax=Amycolatopsis sp. NBRC 101858 TaxID=3032200 RepID=UPI0024A20F26|nr:sigma-70 family RNA polymerase sigma factor [Amycolatopsis sp. NBRC 101858]GLY37930.1 DNA-directed RNA polymerase sigma-70 factor [Amycolatopsis sp. NBRC 101858]